MVSPDDIGGFFSTNWWSGFSSFGYWLSIAFAGMLIVGIFYCIFLLLQYKVKVTYYPLQGDVSTGNIDIGRQKLDRGRRIKKRGIWYFRLLMARKTLKDIPYEKQYTDGIYFVRKSIDEFIPISRPTLSNPSINIEVMDPRYSCGTSCEGRK